VIDADVTDVRLLDDALSAGTSATRMVRCVSFDINERLRIISLCGPTRRASSSSRTSVTSASITAESGERLITAGPGIRFLNDQPTGSVGTLAIAQSNPNIIYVGSGEGLQRPDLSVGDGLYKTTDGGKTWRNMGLRDGQQISQMVVDPKDANRVFVAVLGHPYGPNEERGLYRTLDGGETWKKVLGKDENTGSIDVQFDPVNPRIVYGVLWAARQGPWENGQFTGPGTGLFKSTDGGIRGNSYPRAFRRSSRGFGASVSDRSQ